MKVLAYSTKGYDLPLLKKAAADKHEMNFTEKRLTHESVALASGCEAVALFTSDDASANVLKELSHVGVKYIALRSAGYDHVDLKVAQELDIKVANAPAYSPYSIAEHAVAMLMAVNRKLVESQQLIALQDFRLDTLTGFDIHGKTVGVIGTGKIGIAFARIMLGFGARVLATDPVINHEAEALGVIYVSLAELLSACDVVSIHCPLNDATRNLFSMDRFRQMKKNSIIINTSRGAIINTSDLIEALEKRLLGAACLDVYDKEKGLFFEDHRSSVLTDVNFARLRSFKNVLITGHQAFLTNEAITGIVNATMHNLDCWANGMEAPNELYKVSEAAQAHHPIRL